MAKSMRWVRKIAEGILVGKTENKKGNKNRVLFLGC
jgi:hypothetical protein